jgi:hypothetical protein
MNAFDFIMDFDNPDYENLDYHAGFALWKNKAGALRETIRNDERLSDPEKVMLLSMMDISYGSLEVWPFLFEQQGTKSWGSIWEKTLQYAKADAVGVVLGIATNYSAIVTAAILTGGTAALGVTGLAALKGAVIGSLAFGIKEVVYTSYFFPVHPIIVRYKSAL